MPVSMKTSNQWAVASRTAASGEPRPRARRAPARLLSARRSRAARRGRLWRSSPRSTRRPLRSTLLLCRRGGTLGEAALRTIQQRQLVSTMPVLLGNEGCANRAAVDLLVAKRRTHRTGPTTDEIDRLGRASRELAGRRSQSGTPPRAPASEYGLRRLPRLRLPGQFLTADRPYRCPDEEREVFISGWNNSVTCLNVFCGGRQAITAPHQEDAPNGQISPRHPASKSRCR